MEGQKKFSTVLFGFRKKDVSAYILSMAEEFQKKLDGLEEQNRRLTEQNRELEKDIDELRQERAFISDALLKAKRQAEAIIDEAQQQADRQRSEAAAELQKVREQIASERQRVGTLREAAKDALEYYQQQLSEIEV